MLDASTDLTLPVRASWRGGAGVRALLLVLTAVVVLAAVVWGERSATLGDLQSAVAGGNVSTVEVSGGLPPGAVGESRQEVRWREGRRSHETEVQLVVGAQETTTAVTGADGSTLPVVHQDIGDVVQEWDPDVRVVRVERGPGPYFSGTVLGTAVPGWVGVLSVVQWLGGLFLLVNGPDPRWASRWAWFWLFALPFGVTAFLLLGGPLPGRASVVTTSWRLRGGWAFVASVVLAGAAGWIGL